MGYGSLYLYLEDPSRDEGHRRQNMGRPGPGVVGLID